MAPAVLSNYAKPEPAAYAAERAPQQSYGRQRQTENQAPIYESAHVHSGAPPVTGKKQSTRVTHAPGGNSTIVIG
jgi:hypothetical protein